MKIKRLLPVSLVLSMCIFSSCTKDMDEVSPVLEKSIATDARPSNPGPQQAALTIAFNPNPVEVNQTAIVTATITPKPGEGELWLQKGVDAMGNHTTAALAVDWVTVTRTDVSASDKASHNFMSASVGMYGFRAKYVPKGGSGFLAKDVTGDIEVVQSCSGVSLNGAIVSASNNGNMYTFTVAYTVKSCMVLNGAKLQGGLTNFTNFVSASAGAAVRETGNSNSNISWQLGNLTNGYDQTFSITFNKELKSAGNHTLTGDWSVEGKDAEGNTVRINFEELSYMVN